MTNFDRSVIQSDDASKIVRSVVIRWLQALTISHLIGSFEIMIMPVEMFFFWHDYRK